MLPDLLGQRPEDEQTGTLTASSRQITSQSLAGQGTAATTHAAATRLSTARQGMTASLRGIERDAVPVIRIRRNGRAWKEDCPAARARNETLRATRHDGRAFWKRWTGYHARSRIEADPLMVCKQTTAGQWMRCLKAFGGCIMARDPDRQTAGIQTAVASTADRLGEPPSQHPPITCVAADTPQIEPGQGTGPPLPESLFGSCPIHGATLCTGRRRLTRTHGVFLLAI